MARLPSSFRKRNRATRTFRDLCAGLPTHVKSGVRDACVVFDNDPCRKSLRRRERQPDRRGNHRDGAVSIVEEGVAGLGIAELRRLRALEEENRELRRFVADLSLAGSATVREAA